MDSNLTWWENVIALLIVVFISFGFALAVGVSTITLLNKAFDKERGNPRD